MKFRKLSVLNQPGSRSAPFAAVLFLSALAFLSGCQPQRDLTGVFELKLSTTSDAVQERAADALTALGYMPTRERYFFMDDGCSFSEPWRRDAGLRRYGDEVTIIVRCPDATVEVSVHTVQTDAGWAHYYDLRDRIFPTIAGDTQGAADARTVRHPAGTLPVEELVEFDREPLSDSLEQRVAQWRAGEYPGQRERQRARRLDGFREFALWYGLPALVGTAAFALLWRYVVQRRGYSVPGRRVLFVLLGSLAWAPAPLPMLPFTTVGATLLWPVPGFILLLFPAWIVTGAILIPAAAAFLLWLVSLRAIGPDQLRE